MPAIKEAPAEDPRTVRDKRREPASRTPAAPPATTSGQFGFLRRFAREMDQLFDDFGLGSAWHMPTLLTRGRELLRRETGIVPAEWSPRVDILERDGQLVVRADLPGLCKDDIKVDVTDDTLTIQGERKHEKKEPARGVLLQRVLLRLLLPRHPVAGGRRDHQGDGGVRQGCSQGHGADAQAAGNEGQDGWRFAKASSAPWIDGTRAACDPHGPCRHAEIG